MLRTVASHLAPVAPSRSAPTSAPRLATPTQQDAPAATDTITLPSPSVPARISSAVAPPAEPQASPARPRLAATEQSPTSLAILDAETVAARPSTDRSEASRQIAHRCHAVVFGPGTLNEKADAVSRLLNEAIPSMPSPDPSWTKAPPEQVRLFVLETLEHTADIRRLGELRGLDFSQHDFEGDQSKFNPEITQFLAKPGRDESVTWAIKAHNGSPHHDLWSKPSSKAQDLRESATDIINAWRTNRRVYDKPAWSYEKIHAVINADFCDGRLNVAQRDALFEALPFQRQLEAERIPRA